MLNDTPFLTYHSRELVSKSAGSLRLKTGWKISYDKYLTKYKSSSSSAGNRSSTNTARDDTASISIISKYSEDPSEIVKKSLKIEVDSNGRKLSEEQMNYFAESKILTEDNKLKAMYHGSPEQFVE